ncbi:MAG: DUF4097 domain-containing protein [Vicinamibacterales bacterium]
MRTRVLAMMGSFSLAMAVAGGTAFAQTSDSEWLAQCRDQGGRYERFCEVRQLDLGGAGLLRVDSRPNGGVQITGSDQGAIVGSARIQAQAETEGEARTLATQIQVGLIDGWLRADGPRSGDGRSWTVSFVISAPRRIDVEVEAVNGPVSLDGLVGRIRATTVNGPLSLRELSGDVRARTTNGPLQVTLAGGSWDGEGLDAETRNGPATLRVPEGYSAQLDAGTVNGPFHLGIPVALEDDPAAGRTRRSIQTTIGSGGAPVRVHTTNGPVSIAHRN